VSVAGIIPYRGVYFGMYDSLNDLNPYKKDRDVIGIGSKFAIAQATAITAGYASYPFDTVRRRLQMQSDKPKSEWMYKGTLDCFLKVLYTIYYMYIYIIIICIICIIYILYIIIIYYLLLLLLY
jgi:solute carrier family 25 (adenine nucleotide translocator) protein 4/5/6/31